MSRGPARRSFVVVAGAGAQRRVRARAGDGARWAHVVVSAARVVQLAKTRGPHQGLNRAPQPAFGGSWSAQ